MTLTKHGIREMVISTATLGISAGILAFVAVTQSPWFWFAVAPMFALWVFSIAFFRDPNRTIPVEPGLLVSPADGKVTEITRLDHYEGIDGPALRISIFLSVFDVHLNRAPCGGRVVETFYQPGEFLDARHPESGIRNEANTIIIEPEAGVPGPVIVRQVAGLIARRIVCRVNAGSTMRRGDRIGMIKFGSRTDLIMPAAKGVEPAVKLEDTVRAGATVLIRLSPQTDEFTAGRHAGQAGSTKGRTAVGADAGSRNR